MGFASHWVGTCRRVGSASGGHQLRAHRFGSSSSTGPGERLKYGAGGQVATRGFTPLTTASRGGMGSPALLKELATVAASSV
jgi:hypothetical protein